MNTLEHPNAECDSAIAHLVVAAKASPSPKVSAQPGAPTDRIVDIRVSRAADSASGVVRAVSSVYRAYRRTRYGLRVRLTRLLVRPPGRQPSLDTS